MIKNRLAMVEDLPLGRQSVEVVGWQFGFNTETGVV
jgi:hypothetical protein